MKLIYSTEGNNDGSSKAYRVYGNNLAKHILGLFKVSRGQGSACNFPE